jgi:hypothetical protein
MTMRERLKNGLIAVLIISAVILGWQSRLFGNTSGEYSVFSDLLRQIGYGAPPEDSIKTQTAGAAKPICIVVTKTDGGAALHYGIRYDMKELAAAYDKTLAVISNAFNTASAPDEIGEQAWREALLSPGVYFEYLSPVKISVLDGWFGTEITDDWGGMEIRRLCVTKAAGGLKLCFEQFGTGRFYAADAAGNDGLATLVDSYGFNRAIFAFEVSDAPGNRDLYALLMPDVTAYQVINAENPMLDESVKTMALGSLGITDQSAYHAPSGDILYIDDKFVLTLRPDGTVIYKAHDKGESQKTAAGESEAVELARQAVTNALEPYCGDAAVYFDTIVDDGSGGYLVTFRYIAAGGLVHLYQDGLAAAVTIRSGGIAEMELRYRKYTVLGSPEPLLPELQVSAASAGPFIVCYADNGGSGTLLSPFWAALPAYPAEA